MQDGDTVPGDASRSGRLADLLGVSAATSVADAGTRPGAPGTGEEGYLSDDTRPLLTATTQALDIAVQVLRASGAGTVTEIGAPPPSTGWRRTCTRPLAGGSTRWDFVDNCAPVLDRAARRAGGGGAVVQGEAEPSGWTAALRVGQQGPARRNARLGGRQAERGQTLADVVGRVEHGDFGDGVIHGGGCPYEGRGAGGVIGQGRWHTAARDGRVALPAVLV